MEIFNVTAKIAGVVREVEITNMYDHSPNRFYSTSKLGLARKGTGKKLWPVRVEFTRKGDTFVQENSGYYILNSCAGYLVAWNDANENVSRHNGSHNDR